MQTPLADWIRRRIEAGGPVTFEQFMAWALYHPEYGYYASGRVQIGRDGGDFATAPHLSELFARCMARFVSAVDESLEFPTPFTLVEGGPGEGRLARDLLDTLQKRNPDLYARLVYVLHEVSPELRRRQAAALRTHEKHVLTDLSGSSVVGLYLSNELVDAFPVHRLVRRGRKLLEVHVKLGQEGFREALLPPSRPELLAYVAEEGIRIPEGCEVGINLRAIDWIADVARRLERGYILTLDYGDEGDRLVAAHGPAGTCVAYREHRLSQDVLAAPGHQDLTAHVDFTALKRFGARCGLESAPLLTQKDFLFAIGLAQEVEALEKQEVPEAQRLETLRALGPLILPDQGMGDRFKALVQAKGAPLQALPLDPLEGLVPAKG